MESDAEWFVNYCHRLTEINKDRLKKLKEQGLQPQFEHKDVRPYTLGEMIKHIGMEEAAKKFEVSLASIRSWRWGYRRPSVEQAKKIIIATNGRLDYESIYGSPNEIK